MRKLTACGILKALRDEQMVTRGSVCSTLLKRFRSKGDFLLRLVTVDETWVHYYEPENKAQSRQWVGPGSPRPKNFETQPSAGKMMATVFWDAKGVLMLDFLPKRSTITGVIIIIIIGFLINMQVQGPYPQQWAPFQATGLLHA